MKGTRWAGWILPALAAAALLAGCGTVEEEGKQDDDAAIAREALLTQRDVPAAYVISEIGDEDPPTEEELTRQCPGYEASDLLERSDGDRIFEGDVGVVAQSVTLYDSAADASGWIADMPSRRAHRCMLNIATEGMGETEEAGLRLGEPKLELFEVSAVPGSGGMRLTLPFTSDLPEMPRVEAEAHFVLTARDRAVSMVMLMTMGEPVDPQLRDRLAARAAERLSAALEAE